MKKDFEKQEAIINWEELEKIAFGAGRFNPKPGAKDKEKEGQGGPKSGIGGWDNTAEFYNRMVQMEKNFTLKQIECLDLDSTDTVLDVCCGPGRISVPIAKKVKSVTSVDASLKMLGFLDKYAKEENVNNIKTVLMDWDDKEEAAKVGKHDIAIASRSLALRDIDLLSSLANKYVLMVSWANGAPSIPVVIRSLFKGTNDDENKGRPFPKQDRRLGNNVLYNKVYDKGYDPNVRIMDDGWERIFKDREEAYAELLKLGSPNMTGEIRKMDVFRTNVDKYLTEKDDGSIRFFAATKSMVIWWRTDKER